MPWACDGEGCGGVPPTAATAAAPAAAAAAIAVSAATTATAAAQAAAAAAATVAFHSGDAAAVAEAAAAAEAAEAESAAAVAAAFAHMMSAHHAASAGGMVGGSAAAAAPFALETFLSTLPLASILAPALAPLCGSDPHKQPGRLRRADEVVTALMTARVVHHLATSISHAASVAAAKLEADRPFSTLRVQPPETKRLIEEAIKRQGKAVTPAKALAPGLSAPPPSASGAKSGAEVFTGAQLLYGEGGLAPSMWGVSKAQLALFIDQVRAAHALGHIVNSPPTGTPTGTPPYAQERFDDATIGPSIHQVVARVVKPATCLCQPLPGVAWSLKMNLHRGGLKCGLAFSHSWDEGIYAFAARALAAWPHDVEGAFICFLSLPQHFDIYGRLHPRSSPFYRLLHAEPPPRATLLLSSARANVLTRLWVLLELGAALEERQSGRLGHISVEGRAVELLAGEKRAALASAEDDFGAAAAALHASDMDSYELEAAAALDDGGSALNLDERERTAERRQRMQTRLNYAEERLARTRLDLILAPHGELISFDGATCTIPNERALLREHARGKEDALCRALAALVRQSVAGVTAAPVLGRPEETVDGPLGPLSLHAPTVSLSVRELCTTPKVLQLARWLWSRPAVTALDLSGCGALAPEVPRLLAGALAAGALPALISSNLEGSPLHLPSLKGVGGGAGGAPALDFGGQKLSIASGTIIGSLIEMNSTLTKLTLANNPLRDEGVQAVALALRNNPQCQLSMLELQHTRLGVSAAVELATTVSATPSITFLDISHNRICGTCEHALSSTPPPPRPLHAHMMPLATLPATNC